MVAKSDQSSLTIAVQQLIEEADSSSFSVGGSLTGVLPSLHKKTSLNLITFYQFLQKIQFSTNYRDVLPCATGVYRNGNSTVTLHTRIWNHEITEMEESEQVQAVTLFERTVKTSRARLGWFVMDGGEVYLVN